jgi:hypothetical protein
MVTVVQEVPFQCIAMLLPPMAQQSLVEAQATLPSGLVLALGEATSDQPAGVGFAAKPSAARKTPAAQRAKASMAAWIKDAG